MHATATSKAAKSLGIFNASGFKGTGPAARPNSSVEKSIRNVAYALLSGADGWMFDGEDALGQITTMSLDNHRNLKLAIDRDPVFMKVAEQVAAEMNGWGQEFFKRPIIADWKKQLDFTTKIFRARGLHLDDRHIRNADGSGFSATISDAAIFMANNHKRLRETGCSLVLYMPKIQTAEEAALWSDILSALEKHLGLAEGSIMGYVLVEQIEACVPAHGNPRSAGKAFHRLQHRTMGLHQQRVGRDGVGSDVHQSEHRCDHHDLRLHARLRGPRAPGLQYRPISSVSLRCGKVEWSRIFPSARRRV